MHVKLGLTQDQLYPFFLTNRSLKRPLKFVAESMLGSATTLIPYLRSLLISDIAADGVNRRQELNSVLTFVSKLISMRPWVNAANTGLLLTDGYASAYRSFLQTWQGVPGGSGSWGARYAARAASSAAGARHLRHPPQASAGAGDVVFGAPDLSMTFHVAKYWVSNSTPCHAAACGGGARSSGAAGGGGAAGGAAGYGYSGVPFRGLSNLTAAVLDNRHQPYPYGWGVPGPQNSATTVWDNHNDFDVCTLLSLGWGTLPAVRQRGASQAVGRMVSWATGPESVNASERGSLLCAGQDSIGDCYYFVVRPALLRSWANFRAPPQTRTRHSAC